MDTYEMLIKKKEAVAGQIKRVCENKEKGDLVFLQELLEQIELQILERDVTLTHFIFETPSP